MAASAKRQIARALVAALAALAWLGFAPRAQAASSQCATEMASVQPERARPSQDDDDGPEWLCPLGEPATIGDREIPICLVEGASAVAPLPIHSPGDARIEATRRCGGERRQDWAAPAPEPERQAPPQTPAPAVLSDPPAPPAPASHPIITEPTPPGGTPARGHPRLIYRPPRG